MFTNFSIVIGLVVLTTIFPKSTELQRYIDFFYLFQSESSKSWKHIAFPHVNTGLSFMKNVTINRNGHQILIKASEESGRCIELLGKYTSPVIVNCEGKIDEIAIVFKPLGVNRFIREDFASVAPDCSQPYLNSDWKKAAEDLFHANDRIDFLERFLLTMLSEQEQFVQMEQALSMLSSSEHDFTVSEVAAKLRMTLKTFQRNFSKMLACSPSDYKRIARFRNAINSKIQPGVVKSLTSISYQHNYTDQSYLIREFRKMTNQNPRLFFKEMSLLGEDKIVWEIL